MEDDKIDQNQFFDLVTGEEVGWQTIIYDLVNTGQLDPWDIDISILADKYCERISQLEEADFVISSKVLLACSLLLRMKSDILVGSFIPSLDDALYGRVEEKKFELERITIDENDLPILTPRTPMSRHKKVTLQELMNALSIAIDTETRRIRREIKGRQAEKSALTVLPRISHIPLKIRIKSIFGLIQNHLGEGKDHMKFFHLAPSKEERLASFVPVLHLSNDNKLFLWQDDHFEDIHMTLQMHEREKKRIEEEVGLSTDPIDPQEEKSFEVSPEFIIEE